MRGLRLTLAFLSAACGPPEPEVVLLFPEDGDTVCGTPFALQVAVDNFLLIEPGPESEVFGEGHVDIALNGQNRWMTADLIFSIPEVDEGVTLVEAFLVDGTHHPIVPEVKDMATVTVDASACL